MSHQPIMLDPWVASVAMIKSFTIGSAPQPTKSGSATGFFYKNESDVYLVTNRHVVVNEREKLYPDHLRIRVHTSQTNLLPNRDLDIPLYDGRMPLFLEHQQGKNVDVVVIKINSFLESNDFIHPWSTNYFPQQNDLVELGDSVIVMGYPMAFYDRRHNLPISRSGTLASLYGAPFDGNPYFLIDTNLHPGTSGSPVYIPRSALRKTTAGVQVYAGTRISPPMLLGIHSGEYSADGVKLGLNIVWYAYLIQEIIERARI